MLLWLWWRPAAATLIQPLAWEPPYAAGAALKRKKDREVLCGASACCHGCWEGGLGCAQIQNPWDQLPMAPAVWKGTPDKAAWGPSHPLGSASCGHLCTGPVCKAELLAACCAAGLRHLVSSEAGGRRGGGGGGGLRCRPVWRSEPPARLAPPGLSPSRGKACPSWGAMQTLPLGVTSWMPQSGDNLVACELVGT